MFAPLTSYTPTLTVSNSFNVTEVAQKVTENPTRDARGRFIRTGKYWKYTLTS